MMSIRGLLCGIVLTLLPGGSASGQAVLLTPNVQGGFSDAEGLVFGFLERLSAVDGGGMLVMDGGPCPVPEACLGAAPSEATEFYWLQLSGSPGDALAVAVRLGPDGEVRARAVEEGGDLAALGAALADAVVAGSSPGLDVLIGRRGAQVYLDGERVGRTPLHSDIALASGRHQVTVVDRDGAMAMALLQARAGERALLELDFTAVPPGPEALKRRGAWPLIPLLAGGITAAILVAADPAGIVGPDHRITIVTGP